MRSIKRKFLNIEKRCPFWSSYICFAETIKQSGFSRKSILRWFNMLVDKNDYFQRDKKQLIDGLYILSIRVEEDINMT